MKIAILGNGKMGKKIAELASKKGYEIIAISSSKNPAINLDLSKADVAIDFSTPTTAFENIIHAINSGTPVVSGTTSWLDKFQEVKNLCNKKDGSFLYSSNFSLGMNLFFALNKKLAKIMNTHNYKCKIDETHHIEKLDTPGGTAITLSQDIEKIQDEKIFKSQYSQNLDTLPINQSMVDLIVQEANHAFQWNMEIFQELEGNLIAAIGKVLFGFLTRRKRQGSTE